MGGKKGGAPLDRIRASRRSAGATTRVDLQSAARARDCRGKNTASPTVAFKSLIQCMS